MAIATDLSPELEALLKAGAENTAGLCCMPGQVQRNWKALQEAERRGYVRFLDITRSWITDEGRRAVGAPAEIEACRAALRLALPVRKPLVPTKRDDPRTDFDYRSFQSMGWVCVLVVRQPDYRENATTARVGRTLRSEPQFLGPRNAIIQPESEGRFVLTVVPAWLMKVANFPTYPLPLPEDDPDFSDDERATWERLRQVCFSVNSRIRSAGRKERPAKMRFGETA